jgi:hypothetical protein
VYTLWYDWSDSPFSTCGGQSLAYTARSDDGGASWLPDMATSSAFTDWTHTNSNVIPNQGDYVSLFANGDMVYPCWTDGRLGTPDIWTAPFPIDRPTPTILKRLVAYPVEDGIRVRWILDPLDDVASVALERAEDAVGPWLRTAAEPEQDGLETIVTDRTVQMGREYWYRISVVSRAGVTTTFGPVHADAGAPTAFALSRLAPNPTAGPFTVQFALTRETRVRLALYDLHGRLAAVLLDGVRSAGHWQAQWDGVGDHGTVAAGVYFLRCTADGRTLVKRVAIAR